MHTFFIQIYMMIYLYKKCVVRSSCVVVHIEAFRAQIYISFADPEHRNNGTESRSNNCDYTSVALNATEVC